MSIHFTFSGKICLMDKMFEKSDNSRFLIKKTHRKSIDMTTEILYSVQVGDY